MDQPNMPTAFEEQVRRLKIRLRTCADSKELRRWRERNKNQRRMPEWLPEQGIVDNTSPADRLKTAS